MALIFKLPQHVQPQPDPIAVDVPSSQPSTMGRTAAMVGLMSAAWSAVVAVPLLASVLIQTPAVGDVPPPREDIPQAVAIRTWEAPSWDTQTTRKLVPQTIAVVADNPPPKVESGIVWPENDWPTQVTRKLASSGPEVTLPPIPQTDAGQRSMRAWLQPDWPTQTTRSTPILQSVTSDSPPPRGLASTTIWQWPLAQWDTQATRKTVIPDVHDNPPPRTLAQCTVWQWPQFEWNSQATEKLVQSTAPIAAPAYEQIPKAIWLWPQPDWETPRPRKLVQPERTDNPPPTTTALERLLSLWPEPGWDASRAKKGIPQVQGDAPPGRTQAAKAVWVWTDLEWGPQGTRKLSSPVAQPTGIRISAFPINLWPSLEWPTQTTRKVVQPERTDAPPSRTRAAHVVLLWPQLEWDIEQNRPQGITPIVVGEPYWRAEVESRPTSFEAKERILRFPAKSRRFTMDT